ncbi:hypothetical protein I4U23_021153 [Adineta vaga]|nr:hypothetical protein I4U23_021153 [Adineta vaga]
MDTNKTTEEKIDKTAMLTKHNVSNISQEKSEQRPPVMEVSCIKNKYPTKSSNLESHFTTNDLLDLSKGQQIENKSFKIIHFPDIDWIESSVNYGIDSEMTSQFQDKSPERNTIEISPSKPNSLRKTNVSNSKKMMSEDNSTMTKHDPEIIEAKFNIVNATIMSDDDSRTSLSRDDVHHQQTLIPSSSVTQLSNQEDIEAKKILSTSSEKTSPVWKSLFENNKANVQEDSLNNSKLSHTTFSNDRSLLLNDTNQTLLTNVTPISPNETIQTQTNITNDSAIGTVDFQFNE